MIKKFVNYNNSIALLLSLVVVTMPLKSNFNSMFIILLLAYGVVFLFIKRASVIFKPSKEVVVLILPFLFILIQGFYSEWNVFSKNAIRSLPVIIFPFLFFYLKPWLQNEQIKLVLKSLVFSAVGYSAFLLSVALYRQIGYKPDFSTINWFFFTYYDFTAALDIHPTYLGMYLCMAFAVLFHHLLVHRKRIIPTMLVLAFLMLIIFLSGSRISLVCLILIVISLLMFKMKILEREIKIILIAFVVILPILVFNLIPIVKERMVDMTFGIKDKYEYAKYGDEGENNNYNGGLVPRFQIWRCAIEVGNYNYLFGSGFGTTQDRLNACYTKKHLESFADQDYQTHSQYFNNYARGGLIGVFILLLIYFYTLFFAFKRKHMLHLCLIGIVIVASLTENILNRHMGIVFFTFFNSMFFFGTLTKTNENNCDKNVIGL
jgi:O-antigen ligase